MPIKRIILISLFLLFLTSTIFADSTFTVHPKMKFSALVQSGAFIDISGSFDNGYNFGFEGAIRTSKKIELFINYNLNFVRDYYDKKRYSLSDLTIGIRFLIGKPSFIIKPVIELGIGVCPDFRSYKVNTWFEPSISASLGALIKLNNRIDVLLRGRIYNTVVSGGHPEGFYDYIGIYGGIRYTF